MTTLELQGHQEHTRQHIVNVVIAIYWLLLIEGILRKWLLPQYSSLLYFVRDPLVIYISFLALLRGRLTRTHPMLMTAIMLAMCGIALVFLQNLSWSSRDRLVLAAYGWRNYFLYIPLAFVIRENFRREDLWRLARHTFVLIILVAPLVVAEFFAPRNSALNAGSGEFKVHNLWTGGGRIRPTGTFTNVRGQEHFVTSTLAFILAAWILPKRQRFASPLLLVPATGAAATCLAFSGSRGMFVLAALVMIGAVVASVVMRRGLLKRRAFAIPTVVGALFVVLFPILFPEGYNSFVERWTFASHAEARAQSFGILGRAIYEFFDFLRLVPVVPLFGYGLGIGGNAGTNLNFTINGKSPLTLAEADYARHMIDVGPVFGFAFILFRIALTWWMAACALDASRRSSDPLPIMLFSYVGVVVLYQQIAGHGSINAFGWLFAGFCMAASMSSAPVHERGQVALPREARRAPLFAEDVGFESLPPRRTARG